MTDVSLASIQQTELQDDNVHRLISLAVHGLAPMFDRYRRLFCYRLKDAERGMVQEGMSRRYTMMTLMGLHRLGQRGVDSRFDTNDILEGLLSDLSWVDNLGDLGVLLWLCGVACPERFPALASRLRLETALNRYRGGKQAVTMELAWFLTGLSYCGSSQPEHLARIEPIAFATYKLLTRNQGDRGFFAHLSTSKSLAGVIRGRIGSFADQVYPIYGMAQFSKAYHHEEAAQLALKCALEVCAVQGPMGQWWWHYDSRGGQVVEGYPVYSVHQHAMAPMTLFGLGDVIGHNFDEFIYKGLRWINSNNELSFQMEDSAKRVIWRCIHPSNRSVSTYVAATLGRYSKKMQHDRAEDLKVLFECRPYELGWLLYAFASRCRKLSSNPSL